MTQNNLALQRVRLLCFGAVLGLLPPGAAYSGEADGSGVSSAPPQTRIIQKSGRGGPMRRTGKEGGGEAKMDATQARELYIRRKLRLEQIHAEQTEAARDQRALATNRARMHARLVETARALRMSEKRLGEIEDTLAGTRVRIKEEREKFDDKSAQMSELFVILQGMSRQPPPVLFTHSKDALQMIRSGMVLAAFYEDVEKLAAQISEEVARLGAAEKDAEIQEQRRKAEQTQSARLKAQIDLLLIENRKQLEITSENLENLKSASEINVAGLKNLEEMLPVLDAAAAKKGKSQAGARDEAGGAQLASAAPGRLEPSIAFAHSQGLLPMPVQGRMLIKFGQPGVDGAASKGIHIEARPGAQVVSPCDGTILYAGPFRSYGQLLIIDPGGGYHVVIAGMDRIEVTQGQNVLEGEPIAIMGAEVRSGEKTNARPILYVEFRRDQQSVDPAPWWSAGGKG